MLEEGIAIIMKTISRTVLVVTPKDPYIQWANSIDDNEPKIDPDSLHHSAYLIPESYHEYNYENFLKKHFRIILEEELNAWMADPDVWPDDISYRKFLDWFEIRACDSVIDLSDEPIETKEF